MRESNGVDVYLGDLFAPLPRELEGRVDVIVGVVPYVPYDEPRLLAARHLHFETPLAYDGGADGVDVLRRVVNDSPRVLRPGGALLLELGGEQAEVLDDHMARLGFADVDILLDDDGDVRGLEATLSS